MRALILVDIQNDFMPDGALPVPGGYDVIPIANALSRKFEVVVATQDWHPADHESFASQHPGHAPGEVVDLHGLPQVLWPDHCVQGSDGARFVPSLDLKRVDEVFEKGTDRRVDSYSGFFDNGRRHRTGLGEYLRERSVESVYVLGVATDYCVKWTALDAAELGFKTFVVADGCRGVNLAPGDVERALAELREAGVELVQSEDLP